jgi:TatD DNase family protein
MRMLLVDTHSHLYLGLYDADRDQVINHAAEKGIRKILLPNIDSHSIRPMNQLTETYPGICYGMMGLHPTSVKENYREEFEIIRKELVSGNYIAVGEIGIDLYWDKTHLREQSLVFEQELDLALELDKPVIIHARGSLDVIFEILQKYTGTGIRGIFHAFSGTLLQALDAVDRGFLIGIGGIVTYKNSGLDKTVQEMDLNHMVLETDSPFLSPVPNRGKRNEPAYITYVAETVAKLKSVDIAEIAHTTTSNAQKLFRLINEDER